MVTHSDGSGILETGSVPWIEKIKGVFYGLGVMVLAPFALPAELLVRQRMGRRAYSIVGLLTSYVLILLVYLIVGCVQYLMDWRPTIPVAINVGPLTPLAAGGAKAAESIAPVSPWQSWYALIVFMRGIVVLGLCEKLRMRWRRAKGNEPVTTFTGVSRLDPLWRCAKRAEKWFLSYDSMVKTLMDPLAMWLLGTYVVAMFIETTVGATIAWSAIAMGIKSHLTFAQVHWQTDDAGDQMEIWKQRVVYLKQKRLEGGEDEACPAKIA